MADNERSNECPASDEQRSNESLASDEESSDESLASDEEPSIESLVAEYRDAHSHHDEGEVIQKAVAHSDNLNVFKALQKEAGLGASDLYGYYPTALEQALEYCDHELVAWLLAEGANPNEHLLCSPLCAAAMSTNIKPWVVSALLDAGAKTEKNNPLHRAAAAGELEKVKILIERGADVKAVESEGFRRAPAYGTLLHEAAGAHLTATRVHDWHTWSPDEQEQVVKLLLEKGADTQSKDNQGRLPVDWVLAGAGYPNPVFKRPVDWVMKDANRWPEYREFLGETEEEKHRQRIRALLE